MARCFVGTSGWVYRHWRGVFYPTHLATAHWFEYYAQHLRTVEINNTFYRLPEAGAFEGWRRQAPPGFVYAVKASRYITHLKKLKDAAGPLARFLERARLLGPHLGPVLYQLPPHWRQDLDRLEEFLELLPHDLLQAFEFRDPSWLTPETFALLDRFGAGYCIMDLPGVASPVLTTGRLVYIRFHGPDRVYEGSYSEKELAGWARRIRGFLRHKLPVYVYFNNDAHGYAVQNALRLKEML